MNREQREKRDQMILNLRSQNKTMDEIAEILGTTANIVSVVCRKNGCGGRIRSSWETRDRAVASSIAKFKAEQSKSKAEHRYRELVERLGYTYLGGYTDSDGNINVRSQHCCHAFSVSCTVLRHTSQMISCPVCAEELRQRKKVDEAEQREIARCAKRELKQSIQEQLAKEKEQKRWKNCKECGKTFFDESKSNCKSYCSDSCSNRVKNRYRDSKRRGYKAKISLTQLYNRDCGRCYLCGCTCSFEDYQLIDGAFVVGRTYPTVEHCIPVCKGGSDSWDNVRLACHKCNSQKSILSMFRVESSGQMAFDI